jgi:hypothetical protein
MKAMVADCLEWPGATNSAGYGMVNIGGSMRLVHRIVWMQDNGHTDLLVRHTCDNRRCYRIEHLVVGTHKDNTADMLERRRAIWQGMTHCARGHEYNDENTRIYQGRRYCRKCRIVNQRESRIRKRG